MQGAVVLLLFLLIAMFLMLVVTLLLNVVKLQTLVVTAPMKPLLLLKVAAIEPGIILMKNATLCYS